MWHTEGDGGVYIIHKRWAVSCSFYPLRVGPQAFARRSTQGLNTALELPSHRLSTTAGPTNVQLDPATSERQKTQQ